MSRRQTESIRHVTILLGNVGVGQVILNTEELTEISTQVARMT